MVSNRFLSLTTLLTLAASAFAANVDNPIYVISNAETPSLNLPGLTPVGLERATQCLPPLLAPLNIGLIISCPFDPESGVCKETVATATPTAEQLGLTVNTSCGADEETDDDCISDLIKTFAAGSTQSILIVWDIQDIDSVFENLDIDDDVLDGDDDDDDDEQCDIDECPHYDLLFTVIKNDITAIISQGCPGLDGQAPGTTRRSLRRRSQAMKKRQTRRQLNSRISGRLHAEYPNTNM